MSDFLLAEGGLILTSEDGDALLSDADVTASVTSLLNYDLMAAIDILFPGVVVQRNLIDAAQAALIAKGSPLASTDVTAILVAANVLGVSYDATTDAVYVPTEAAEYETTLPTYPTGMPRFPDSNPAPDGWSIVMNEKVVQGGSG